MQREKHYPPTYHNAVKALQQLKGQKEMEDAVQRIAHETGLVQVWHRISDDVAEELVRAALAVKKG